VRGVTGARAADRRQLGDRCGRAKRRRLDKAGDALGVVMF
jgi:hypothetical protein